MSWVFLMIAGICEMLGVALINKVNAERSWQSVVLLAAGFGASFLFLNLAMKGLPMSTAYAVWTGIGASGGAMLGMMFYGEPRNALRLLFIAMVLGAAIGLKLVS